MTTRFSTAVALALLVAPGGNGTAAETRALELDAEFQSANDLLLTQTTAAWFDRTGPWQWNLAVSGASIALDYEPVALDFFGRPASLEEARFLAQAGVKYQVVERLSLQGTATGYTGFTDYQSVWINEWYQQFFAGLPGLADPDPNGRNASFGLRWEYLRGAGWIESSLTYAFDEIAPGYDEIIDPVLGLVGVQPLSSELETLAASVRFENILHRRVRTRVELRLTDQDERSRRLAAVGSLNWAFAEDWVARLEGGYAAEDPDFEAWWFGGTLERRLGEHWWLSGFGRRYEDTGEIENSLSFTTSSPALRAWTAGVGLRGQWGRHSFKLTGGPYYTEYAPVDFSTIFFANLYRDRSFGLVQAAYRFEL